MNTPDFRAAVRGRLPAAADDADVVAELAAQLEDAYDAALARGADPSEALRDVQAGVLGDARAWQQIHARLEARRGWTRHLDACSALGERLHAWHRHLREAVRYLRRDRRFTAAVTLTLAVCGGVTAAVVTVANAVLVRPLPFPRPHRVVLIAPQTPGSTNILSDIPSYFDRRQSLTVFEEMAMFRWVDVVFQTDSVATRVRGDVTTASLFTLIGVSPLHGRLLEEPDEQPDAHRKILLSHGLWTELFGRQPWRAGRELLVDGESFTVVGVMPPGFGVFRLDARFWIPAVFSAEQRADGRRGWRDHYQIGRLADGVTPEEAERQLAELDRSESERFPNLRAARDGTGRRTTVEPLHDVITREVRPTLLVLLVGSGVVLALGVLNMTTLAVARSRRSLGEIATRHVLGGRWRAIATPLLAQGAVIGSVGGVGALAIAAGLLALMRQVGLQDVPRADTAGLDGRTAIACVGVIILTALVITTTPLLVAARVPLAVALRGSAPDRRTMAGARYLRRVLVVGQVAAAFVLMATMGWTLVSLTAILSEDPGFNSAGVVTVHFDVPRPQYPGSNDVRDLVSRVVERVRRLPGVDAAGITDLLPLGGRTASLRVRRMDQRPADAVVAWAYVVSPGYFTAMGVALHAGRYLDEGDTAVSEPVVIVARGLAERLWPGANPVGQQIVLPPLAARHPLTVVGVVEDIRQASLVESAGNPGAVYRVYMQADERSFTLAARTVGRALAPAAISAAIRSVDQRLAPYDAAPMPTRVNASVAPRRLALANAAVFAGTGLLLATIGLYAVLTYLVAERRREFGIRLALGSSPRTLAMRVVAEGLVMAAAGLIIGGIALRVLWTPLGPYLYGVASWYGPILLAAGVLIAAAALLASLGPAGRASRVDPVVVLQG